MIAVEIEAPIVNHRIDFSSERLPSNIVQAKIIVMYEEPSAGEQNSENIDIVALARIARASFPKRNSKQLHNEFHAVRSEWDDRGYGQ
ncbi:hypothetical protein [Propionivibrio sp.]|uniref:hypothetical protein n=1 Tax=Propionivibrio sp. TaxID=2212460 RepID=UPI003BF05378